MSSFIDSIGRHPVAVFSDGEIADAIPLDASVVAAVERSFVNLQTGRVCMPPTFQLWIDAYSGQACVKGAWIPDLEYFAVKLSCIYPRAAEAELAEANGMFVVLECATGAGPCVLARQWLSDTTAHRSCRRHCNQILSPESSRHGRRNRIRQASALANTGCAFVPKIPSSSYLVTKREAGGRFGTPD